MSVIENMVIRIDIDQSETTGHEGTWWSLPAEKSAEIYQEYEDKVAQVKSLIAQMRRAKRQRRERDEDRVEVVEQLGEGGGGDEGIMVMDSTSGEDEDDDKELTVTVQFDWTWPDWKKGTKIVDGHATNVSSYTLNFDTMMQENNDTHFVRKFRVVSVLLPNDVTTSDEDSFDKSIDNIRHRQIV
jgi:hypothetical protein